MAENFVECVLWGFGVVKVQCGSFLNITLSLSNYSVILVHLLRGNGATAERFAVSVSHSYSIVTLLFAQIITTSPINPVYGLDTKS